MSPPRSKVIDPVAEGSSWSIRPPQPADRSSEPAPDRLTVVGELEDVVA